MFGYGCHLFYCLIVCPGFLLSVLRIGFSASCIPQSLVSLIGSDVPKISAYMLSNAGATMLPCMSRAAIVLKRSMSARRGIFSVTKPWLENVSLALFHRASSERLPTLPSCRLGMMNSLASIYP